MGTWLPAAFLSMQPWSWWVMMQPASVSRQKVSVLTSHSLIAWITTWTYHLDSHLRHRGFVHLLPGCLPDACCFIFLAIVSTCFPFLTLLNSCHDYNCWWEYLPIWWILRHNYQLYLSMLFLLHVVSSFFVIFVPNLRTLPPSIPKVAIFLCPFSYERIYFWIQCLSSTVLGGESCCKPHLAKIQPSIITIIITLKSLKSLSESNTTVFIILHWCALVHGSCSSLLS
jgi:hypothetical protein